LAASRRGAGPALAAVLEAAAFVAGFGIGFDIADFFLSDKRGYASGAPSAGADAAAWLAARSCIFLPG
jgi:hypothetical protein